MPSQRIEYMLAEEVSSAPRAGAALAPGGPPSPDYTRQVTLTLVTDSPQSGQQASQLQQDLSAVKAHRFGRDLLPPWKVHGACSMGARQSTCEVLLRQMPGWSGRWGCNKGGTVHVTRMAATQSHSCSAAGERQQGDEPFQGSLCEDVAIQPKEQPVCFAVESLRQPGESSAVQTSRQHHLICICQIIDCSLVSVKSQKWQLLSSNTRETLTQTAPLL